MKRILLILFLLGWIFQARSQSSFYNSEEVREIKITFFEKEWDQVLDSLFEEGENGRLLANLSIDGKELDSVGVRYKGFSSVSVDRIKNPFNIKLDYVKDDQSYKGIDKIKLSNVIHDPTFVREVLSYEIARKYMPASGANYAKLFINDVYWGLYTNVESVNKDFVEQHFGSRNNSFFKGNPEKLEFPFGDNSNLKYKDDDTTSYEPYYSLESDAGWGDLLNLIKELKDNPDKLGEVLNVDRTLWMHAFNYALVNLDSYIAYAQNYYLYNDNNNRFNPVLWDLNMSFGSFRNSDGSHLYEGLTIDDAKVLDPLTLMDFTISDRPLFTQLMGDKTHERMFFAHMRTILTENFDEGGYFKRAQELQELIKEDVEADTNKFYSNDDFVKNLEETVGGSGAMIEYPGIKELVEARLEYLHENYTKKGEIPEISNVKYSPEKPEIDDEVIVTAEIKKGKEVFLAYRYENRGVYKQIKMLDDGDNGDGDADDGVYGAKFKLSKTAQYYIYAENEEAGMFSPEGAAYRFHIIEPHLEIPDIVINEFMADNGSIEADQDDEFEDWVELYNTTDKAISLDGLYLTDDTADMKKWGFPDGIEIKSKGFLVVWLDSDLDQEGLHAGFKLSKKGDFLALAYSDDEVVDSITFGPQVLDRSTGRSPNGKGDFFEMTPTFNTTNEAISVEEFRKDADLLLFPNPADEVVNILIKGIEGSSYNLELIDANGRIVESHFVNGNNNVLRKSLNLNAYSRGVYCVKLVGKEFATFKKLIVY